MSITSPEVKTTRILLIILAMQGPFVIWSIVSDPMAFLKFLGFIGGTGGTPSAWLLAAATVVAYVWSSSSISVVRLHMLRINKLKLLSIVTAVVAGILEEVVFRKWVMDYFHYKGYGPIVEIFAAGVSFGLGHLIWGAKSFAAGVNAVLSTTALGVALGVVYILAGRNLAPCIAAHFLITALIEPGLILAAVTDKLGYLNERPRPSI